MITKLPTNAIEIAERIEGLADWKGRAAVNDLKQCEPQDFQRKLARLAEKGPPYAKLVQALVAAKEQEQKGVSPNNKKMNPVNS